MPSAKASQKLQSSEKFIKDPLTDKHRARIWCKVMRLTVPEGLEYMKQKGYEMKKDRYNQLLTEINKNVNKRLLFEMQQGFIEQHFASIDIIENLIDDAKADILYLKKQKDLKSRALKSRIRQELNSYIPLLSSYKSRTQYVYERQAKSKKLISEVGTAGLNQENIELTEEAAKELGIEDYGKVRGAPPPTTSAGSDKPQKEKPEDSDKGDTPLKM